MNTHETRHSNWVPVGHVDGAIRGGDRYRFERSGGAAYEFVASYDWEQKDFIPGATYFVWPRPEPKPYEAIPEDISAVMAVSVDGHEPVVGTYYRDGAEAVVRIALPGDPGLSYSACYTEHVTSAVPMTVVPTEALEVLRSEYQKWNEGPGSSRVFAAVHDLLEGVQS